jgi:hypothetical protein
MLPTLCTAESVMAGEPRNQIEEEEEVMFIFL